LSDAANSYSQAATATEAVSDGAFTALMKGMDSDRRAVGRSEMDNRRQIPHGFAVLDDWAHDRTPFSTSHRGFPTP
jgi:hypothetical protein